MKAGKIARPGAPPNLERVAAATLGLPDEAPLAGDAVRIAFLRRLRETQFLPSRIEHEAFDVLTGRPAPSARLKQVGDDRQAQKLESDIEAFAAAFFSVEIPERRLRWDQLNEACSAHDRLLARLRVLRRGLELARPEVHDPVPDVVVLARHCFELFALPPHPQVLRRQAIVGELLSTAEPNRRRWSRAVRELRRRHAAVAALTPELLNGLSVGRPRPPRRLRAWVLAMPEAGQKGLGWRWLFLLVPLVGSLNTLLQHGNPTNRISSPPVVSAPDASVANFLYQFRESMKQRLRLELTALGCPSGDSVLDDVLAAFPPNDTALAPFFGSEKAVFLAQENDRARLKAALDRHGIVLDREQLDRLLEKALSRRYQVFPAPRLPGPESTPEGEVRPE